MHRTILMRVTNIFTKYSSSKRRLRVIVASVIFCLMPLSTQAAGLAPRSVKLGSSQAGVVSPNIVNATTATAANIGSIGFQYCTLPSGSCVVPTGLTTTAATLTAQSGALGFTIVSTTNGSPYITRAASLIASSVSLSYTLSGIQNPAATNTAYFVRITTYTGSDGATGPTDTGTVAVSTAQQVQLTGVTPEILVFCVGTNITSDCTTMTGSVINFGDFSPTSTRTGTSVMQAATNAATGYNITVTGTTLSSGVNTIPALVSQTASTVGLGQYGLNLRSNTVPLFGTEPSVGSGALGVAASSYGTSNQYRFVSGDTVATAPAPTNANTFTSSYIVNIGGAQAAGVYSATMTYICTANF
jgi:hypothetical protein